MKVVKDRSNGSLAKLPNDEAKQLIEGNPSNYCYSSKGSLKSRFNSHKKQYRRQLRLYFRHRQELKR